MRRLLVRTWWFGVLLVGLLGGAASAQDFTSNLQLYLKFEELSGTSAADSSGNARTATLFGNAAFTANGKIGRAITLDGSGDYITGTSGTNTAPVSLAAWIFPVAITAGAGQQVYSDTADRLALQLESTDPKHVAFAIWNGSTWIIPYHATILPTNTWTHLVGTYDGANVRLYVNGIEASNSPQAATGTSALNGTFYAGMHYSAINSFNGRIDELRLYSRALSQADVTALFQFTGDAVRKKMAVY
jgi:Concanavalin A-like lectin/glucanases superfamily